MPQQQTSAQNISRARWFGFGALAASLAFATLLVAGDVIRALDSEAEADTPSVVIEGN